MMQVDENSFAEQYSHLSDSELLAVDNDRRSLMDAAITALDLELARRGLKTGQASQEEFEAPNREPQDTERPYRWGRFVGGMTVVGAVLTFGSAIFVGKLDSIVVSLLYGILGFGIYEKRKWAVLVLEVGSCLGLIGFLLFIFLPRSYEAFGQAAFFFMFYAPQVIYFWKRRNELR